MQSRSVMGGGLRLSRVLVAVQIALCFGALVAAGLLGRSLANLKASDVGFDREHVAYATVSPGRAGYTAERRGPYLDRLRDSLSRVPGVLQVSPVQTRPLSGGGNNGRVNIAGRPYDDTSRANMNRVGDGFFDLLRMPVIAGRALDRRDMDGTSGAVVVDDVFARRFFPGENALGRRFGMGQTDNQGSEIVGIVGNSKYNSMRSDAYPTVYEPYRPGGTIHLAIRTTLDGSGLTETIRRTVASIDPAVPLAEFHTQSGLIDRLLRTERLLGVLSGAFGVAAVTLAAIGLAGLLAYAVARRTSEIGVRLALGATARDVVRMVLRDSLTMVAAGIVLGIPLAYAIARLLGTMLFMVKPSDPWTVLASFGTLLAAALVAAWIPARRAASVDPIAALRAE
jgi:predicted permease